MPSQQPVKKNQFAQMEEGIADFWEEHKVFEQSVQQRPADNQYIFYDGPPFATGLPHYGHMLASVSKDMVPRFWTMRGKRVERRWGWDCHGLPIENIIEKDFNLNSRKDIEDYGIDKFNAACRSRIGEYDREWAKFVKRIGRWVDFEHSYKTMDNEYMESVWWGFKQLHDKDLVYEGRRVSLYCPRCQTPLSNFEIAMDNSYKDVSDPSVIWKFPLTDEPNTSVLAWTTTPWSTPGTTGLSVGPDFDYVKIQVGDEFVICAKARLDFVTEGLESGSWTVVDEFKGASLVGKQYEPILGSYKQLPEVAANKNTYHIFAADYVDVEEGTGIVTINGSYGEIDMEAAKANDLPLVFDVGEDGRFNALAGAYANQPIREAQITLMDDMQAAGRVWRQEPYTHSYPHCWRCDTPLFYFATRAWFVAVTKIKTEMLAQNQQINWKPDHLKDGRFGIGLETAPDWNISRSRFWGTAMPVWECQATDCDERRVIGSVQELSDAAGRDLSELDLHRPYIDEVTFDCSACSGIMQRIPEVFDCWVESGSMPFAEKHYPFENKETFEQFYPAEFISEYIAQTRGWFYTLHVLSTALFGKPSFTNAVTTGTIMAEDGDKMSKSKKNYPDPQVLFDTFGVDAVRFYLMASPVMSGERINFSEKEVAEVYRKYVNTLWNVYTFYQLFADSAEDVALITDPAELTNPLDQWVLATVQQTTADITTAYETYHIRGAVTPLLELVQEISTWYVRRSRDRFKGQDQADRLMALRTLKTVLLQVCTIAAPVTPFITESIYQKLRSAADPLSIHLCDWADADRRFINTTVLSDMQTVRDAVEALLALRQEAGIKIRQPLAAATVAGAELAEAYQAILRDELNVKAIQFGAEFALDTQLTPELEQEGLLRELVRTINNLRKKAGLSIHDRIQLHIQTDSGKVTAMLAAHGQELQQAVLADDLTLVTEPQEKTAKINGETVTIGW